MVQSHVQTAISYGTGSWPQSVFSTDHDSGGDNDLAVAAPRVSIIFNLANASIYCCKNLGNATRVEILIQLIYMLFGMLIWRRRSPRLFLEFDIDASCSLDIADLTWFAN